MLLFAQLVARRNSLCAHRTRCNCHRMGRPLVKTLPPRVLIYAVRTDHKQLVGVFRRKDTENPRLQRILAKLDNYHFIVEYIGGKDNAIANALSRYPVDPPEADTKVEATISTFGTDRLIAELLEAAGDSYQ